MTTSSTQEKYIYIMCMRSKLMKEKKITIYVKLKKY